MPKSVACEAAYFLVIGKLAVINNSDAPVNTGGDLPEGRMTVSLTRWGIAILDFRNQCRLMQIARPMPQKKCKNG